MKQINILCKCTDVNNTTRLTLGKHYKAVKEYKIKNGEYYVIINDKNQKESYLKRRFEIIIDHNTGIYYSAIIGESSDMYTVKQEEILRFKVDTKIIENLQSQIKRLGYRISEIEHKIK